ncbi:tRNA lysidine(34) synthetase TilS [Schaalia sp. ZJ405]|uniref:tRNA lysidine(34) synthetase TilS n=1 Tax=Schaalia sp. ZJ405 TaxID=2709403 RepID=UPI0013EAED1D|nr:tRNA lysidine(34) synthetase TilS [Schaalia sp. ZJ405]QPK81549.1 tRNA lysidine(34) synthetase TilS [Schaalia sp. ZJ405]
MSTGSVKDVPGVGPLTEASRLIGAQPTGAVARITQAVRRTLRSLTDHTRDGENPGGLIVGLSGGADSLALAVATIDCGVRMGFVVHTVTVDHGVRPESGREAQEVAQLATRLGAIAHVERVTLARGGGPEGGARQARRSVLVRSAGNPPMPVMLGHTLDDQAETVLLRLARGSGVGSLRAIAPDVVDDQGVRWLRPLLGIRRSDTRQFLVDLGLTWWDDPTNDPHGPWVAADGTPLRRAALRASALPVLATSLGVDPAPALARTAQLAADDDDALTQWADRAWQGASGDLAEQLRQVEESDEGGLATWDASALNVAALDDLPVAVLRRVLGRFVREHGARGGDLNARHHDELASLVTRWRGQGPLSLPGTRVGRIRDEQGRAWIVAMNDEHVGRCNDREH